MVVKIELPDRPILPIHSLTSFIEYLSTKVWALRAQKSCTNQMPPFSKDWTVKLAAAGLNYTHLQPLIDVLFHLFTVGIRYAELLHIHWFF